MVQKVSLRRPRLFVGVAPEQRTLADERAPALDLATSELRALQVAEDPNRPLELHLGISDRRVELARDLVSRMAHVDAENINACRKQALEHVRVGRGGAERRDDFDPAFTLHLRSSPELSGSGRRMVQS